MTEVFLIRGEEGREASPAVPRRPPLAPGDSRGCADCQNSAGQALSGPISGRSVQSPTPAPGECAPCPAPRWGWTWSWCARCARMWPGAFYRWRAGVSGAMPGAGVFQALDPEGELYQGPGQRADPALGLFFRAGGSDGLGGHGLVFSPVSGGGGVSHPVLSGSRKPPFTGWTERTLNSWPPGS